jgi:hypothetical protein
MAEASQPNQRMVSPPFLEFSHGTCALVVKNQRAVGNEMRVSSPAAASPPRSVKNIPIQRMVTRI